MLHKTTLQLQKMQLHLNYHKLVLLGRSLIHFKKIYTFSSL